MNKNEISALRKVRVLQGKTQLDIALQSKISQSLLSLYERELKKPDKKLKLSLAKALGVSIDKIFPHEKNNVNRIDVGP